MGKTAAEMKESHGKWLAAQPMLIRCQIGGCPWTYEGPAEQGQEQARAHRQAEHPDLNPRSRAQIVKDTKAKKPISMSPTTKPKGEAAVTETVEAPARGARWTLDLAIRAVKDFAITHGRPPISTEAVTGSGLPSPPTATKLAGSWADLIERAGFPRPNKATRTVAKPKSEKPKPERKTRLKKPSAVRADPAVPAVVDAARVETFLCLLLRDELPAGAVERLVAKAERATRQEFSGHVAAYASELAGRLLESPAKGGTGK